MTKAEAPDKGIHPDQYTPEEETAYHHHRQNHYPSSEEIFLSQLGKNIGERLQGRRIAVADFARRTGVSIETLRRILAGKTKPNFHTLYRIAQVIGPICVHATKNHHGKH